MSEEQPAVQSTNLEVGQRVRLVAHPPYVKTAEPMPMLRPPSVIAIAEEGTVLKQASGGYWAIRFERGAFLLERQYLAPIT